MKYLTHQMDHSGADELMKILHQLDGTNVFVISHRGDILQDKFSHVIKFSKAKFFSHCIFDKYLTINL